MSNKIPQDLKNELQRELLRVVDKYNRKNKKAKKSKTFTHDKNKNLSKINRAVLSVNKSLKQKQKQTKKNKILIERHTQTYTNVNGVEQTTSEEVIGDSNKIKITKIDKNGVKHVKTIHTPQMLLTPPTPYPKNRLLLTTPAQPNFSKSFFNPRFL
jgi:hypothetical protein